MRRRRHRWHVDSRLVSPVRELRAPRQGATLPPQDDLQQRDVLPVGVLRRSVRKRITRAADTPIRAPCRTARTRAALYMIQRGLVAVDPDHGDGNAVLSRLQGLRRQLRRDACSRSGASGRGTTTPADARRFGTPRTSSSRTSITAGGSETVFDISSVRASRSRRMQVSLGVYRHVPVLVRDIRDGQLP